METDSVASSTTGRVKRPEYCSICWCEDGKKGMLLQDCSECGVLFHNHCYGRGNGEEYDPSFRCWACLAVGTTVKGRALDTKRHDVLITERPTECALCSVNMKDIPLAMHPLYDDHGTKGRQIILKQGASLKAAWCHTLCAQFICVNPPTRGCVYGCTASGYYMGDDDVEVERDNRSVNSELARMANDDQDAGIHHFVVVLPTWRGENEWSKRIEEAKKHLTCYICKRNDEWFNTVRFAVQCSANEPSEVAGKDFHKTKTICTEAVHVGCAIWHRSPKKEWPRYRQVYFFPGQADRDPVVDIYCFAHAKGIFLHPKAWRGAQYRRFPEPNDKWPKNKVVTPSAASLEVEGDTSARSDLPTGAPQCTKPASFLTPPGQQGNDLGRDDGNEPSDNCSPPCTTDDTTFPAHHQAAEPQPAAEPPTSDMPRKRYKRSSLLVAKEPGRSERVTITRGSPVTRPIKKDWSALVVGPTYDPTMLDFKDCCSKLEPVDPNDIEDE